MIVNFPGQAVILCGGLGTRLRPYTFSKPKPMVDINGKPFLYYLLKQLSEIGITRYVLLLGYKSNEIINYFGNGCEYGWNIEYSIGDISWDTGTRILNASSMLDEHFILMYSDNFVQHKFDALFSKYVRSIHHLPYIFRQRVREILACLMKTSSLSICLLNAVPNIPMSIWAI